MPIYEYRCSACGFQHEYLQRLSEPALSQCPECGRDTFTKLVSAAGFQLKGTGWYVTDFKNSGKRPPARKGNGADSSGADSGKEKGSSGETACGSGACEACA
jgi:putative FmdB family regulatory protein